VALTRFKRTLRRARLAVRQLTHTLHLPPALSEIYGGPNASWLRDVLEYLPNLQSLIVSQLPFFDHHSLLALRYASNARRQSVENENDRPQYDLKLLLAEREPNITSVGLSEALFHFPHLVYLDLSYTSPVRGTSVLFALANLWDLQVLKLRGVGMRDGEAEILANAIGLRVRLLDLRENQLTDMAVRSLLQACFLPPDRVLTSHNLNTRHLEDWPVGILPGPDFLSLDSLRTEQFDRELLKQLTHPLTGRLAFEDIPHKGLTHLYVADNNISVEGLSSLLSSTRLHLLDGGSLDTVKTISRTKNLSSSTDSCYDKVGFPGAEKLAPVLATYASHNLTYLRVDHSVITEAVPAEEAPSPAMSVVELESERTAIVEAPAHAHYAVELPSENDVIFELPSEPLEPKSELPGDCVHFALSPPVNAAQHENCSSNDAEACRPKRGDGVFAPELVTNGIPEKEKEALHQGLLNTSGSGRSSTQLPVLGRVTSDKVNISELQRESSNAAISTGEHGGQTPPPSPPASRLARIETLLRKRPVDSPFTPETPDTAQTDHCDSSHVIDKYLHPSHLPNLRTLVLTGVPTHVPASAPTIAALLRFIAACADEAYLALLQAQTNYSLPPGRSRHAAEVQHARSLFALRTIVLEMSDINPSNVPQGKAWDHSHAKINMLKSSTGDRDSEALWSAAENDFSFFGEEGEEQNECGIYDNEPDKYFPTARMDEKIVWNPDDEQIIKNSPHGSVSPPNSLPIRSSTGRNPALLRSSTLLHSPRNLPLGRNRRQSGAASNRKRESLTSAPRHGSPLSSELPATIPTSFSAPTPPPDQDEQEPLLDVVAELAKFRKQKKKEHETALSQHKTSSNNRQNNNPINHPHCNTNPDHDSPTTAPDADTDMSSSFIEGHWEGEIKIVRNAAPKGRSGVVDMYGNYFEKGYLYP
jgi:hypothetical protein